MNTPKVHHEPVIDEHPHIVVASELKDLAAIVRKHDVVLGREEVVVPTKL